MSSDVDGLEDLELRLVDPTKNRFRIYGLTECRTLFGELCLRIVWGRIGNRRQRERSEVFGDRATMLRRREELLGRRRRHGYVASSSTPRAAARQRAETHQEGRGGEGETVRRATERAIVEAHGLSLGDASAWKLVAQWHAATVAIVRYLEARGAAVLDLVDASTLAGMFVSATAA